MDTLKVHIQSNYLTINSLSLIQTKLAEKKTANYLFYYALHSSVSDLKSVIALSLQDTAPLA